MSTDKELRTNQKSHLYDLLKLKKDNPATVIGLNELIVKARAIMDAEDVAYVEKQIELLS